MKKKKKIEVSVTFTAGWEERFTKAAYELWVECKNDKQEQQKTAENSIGESY